MKSYSQTEVALPGKSSAVSEQRRRNMQHIRSCDTKPEETVRTYLHRLGFRYRKNDRRYPGKPDIVLPKYKTIVFVHGCFWHQHKNCKYAAIPKSNQSYWLPKLARNTLRDRETAVKLTSLGWNVIVFWECALRVPEKSDYLTALAEAVESKKASYLEIPELAGGALC